MPEKNDDAAVPENRPSKPPAPPRKATPAPVDPDATVEVAKADPDATVESPRVEPDAEPAGVDAGADAPTVAIPLQKTNPPRKVTRAPARPAAPRPAAASAAPAKPGSVADPKPPVPPKPDAPQTGSAAPEPTQAAAVVPAPADPEPAPTPEPLAKPQRVPAAAPADRPRRKKRWAWLAVAAVVLAAAVAGGVFAWRQYTKPETPEQQVQASIESFGTALQSGNLQALRDGSCGALHDYYTGVSDKDFADMYKAVSAQKTIPVISNVEAVQVSGDKAIAQVTASTKADPKNRTNRTFTLQKTDQGWKVCDPPA